MARREPNEGTLYQCLDGRWAAGITVGHNAARRVRKWTDNATRREVATKLVVGPLEGTDTEPSFDRCGDLA